ncbi:hypothetical protein [Enterobacter roggenkampii]|uniref:Uncharacterized protein n=2 Tax=Enterobacterales TaxID=91347 RepID=A0ABD7KP86_9ENTR|nr:hypothetical protein [Enterobacter roggenkampii]SAD26820.1 Uncharacterised protein [Enterobacter roggenkampii]
MKYLIAAGFILISFNSMANNGQLKKVNIPEQAQKSIKTENDFISAAIKDGYQTQRNLAFAYQTGSSKTGGYDFIKKNETKSCAWRKILLVSNPDKMNSTDPMNERQSCRNLDFKQDEEVWKIVYRYLPLIDEAKAKGEYMVKKDVEPESNEPIIIDVTQ